MRPIRYLIILAALALAGAAGAAGPAADDTIQQRIDRLERELNELKTDTKKLETTGDSPSLRRKFPCKFEPSKGTVPLFQQAVRGTDSST
jgi:hypothetical protein